MSNIEGPSEFPASSPVPRPWGRYRRADLWRAASGYDLDRMMLKDPAATFPLYRAQWLSGDGRTQLVCLQYPGAELFGTPYRVFVYDRNLGLVRSGGLTAQQDYEPLAIVEVKPAGKRIPATRSGVWQLAIVLANRKTAWDLAKPIRLVGFEAPDDQANYVMCELVSWDGDGDLTGAPGTLAHLDSIEFRTVEKNWRVTADGTVHVPSSELPRGAP